jgi:hypothetical protein
MLSGVGSYSDGYYIGPISYDERWSVVHNRIPTDCRQFNVKVFPYSGVFELLMHASCCSLLEQCFYPRPIPLARLVEVCRSCPTGPVNGFGLSMDVSWSPSYNYGQTFPLLHKYPWDESDIVPNYHNRRPTSQDPWNIPSLIRRLQNSKLNESTQVERKESRRARWKRRKPSPKKQKLAPRKLVIVGDIASNYFTELPREILEYVLAYIPIEDVKSLAQTCKGLKMIIPSGLGQFFWASRFQVPSFERGFAFEALTHGRGVNFKSLYFKMRYVRGLRNRRRIWGLLLSISQVLSLQWNDAHALLQLDKNENELRWKEVHGFLQQPQEHRKIQVLSSSRLYTIIFSAYRDSHSTQSNCCLYHFTRGNNLYYRATLYMQPRVRSLLGI